VFVPVPVGEYPLCHYLRVPDQQEAHERA